MKKRFIALAMGAAMATMALCSCAPSATGGFLGAQSGTSSLLTISSSTDGTTVNLLSGDVYTFASNYVVTPANPYSANFCNGTTQYNPTPAHIEWTDSVGANYYTVKLSRSEDMSGAEYYSALTNSIDVEDLFMGTKYYYQVYAHRDTATVKSKVFSFTTAYLPRTIRFDTTHLDANTRDIGGYYTEDGNYRIKQGIAIRGAEVKHYTQEAKNKMLYNMGIKTELAVHGEETSLLGGEGINYVYTHSPHYVNYGGIHYDSSAAELAKSILVFANADNYPIFFHCQLGRDRTGTLAFLINALCGVGEKDLFLDYEMSYLSQYGGYSWNTNGTPKAKTGQFERMFKFINEGRSYQDDKHDSHGDPVRQHEIVNPHFNPADTTLAERTATFLKGQLGAYGINDQVIAQIRANMLEEV